jgi:hypothetical protein
MIRALLCQLITLLLGRFSNPDSLLKHSRLHAFRALGIK